MNLSDLARDWREMWVWLLWGFGLALLDVAVVGAFRLLVWVVEKHVLGYMWLWVLAMLVLVLLRYRIQVYVQRKNEFELFHFKKRLFDEQLQHLNVNSVTSGSLDSRVWCQRVDEWILWRWALRDLWFYGVQMALLFVALFFLAWPLAVLVGVLAWYGLKKKAALEPVPLADWDLDPLQRWWALCAQLWPSSRLTSSRGRIFRSKKFFYWSLAREKVRVFRKIMKAESRAQLISVLILGIASVSYLNSWMDMGEMLALLVTVVLMHKPFKQWYASLLHRGAGQGVHEILKSMCIPRGGSDYEKFACGLSVKIPVLAYGPRVLLENFTLDLAPGERRVLYGASGSGKTTLLRIMAGLLPMKGVQVCRPGHLVYMDQNLIAPLFKTEEIQAFILSKWVDRLGLGEVLNHLTKNMPKDAHGFLDLSSLSGGELQRLVLLALLCENADLLILDEPFSKLPAQQALELSRIIAEDCAEKGVILVLSSHIPLVGEWWDGMGVEVSSVL